MTAEDLRKAILQQAIQGKLVAQDATDEPASKLLERIREEKARLVKEKKIKKDKNESIIYRGEDNSHYEKVLATGKVKCIDDDIPFEIPNTWEWIRISSVIDLLSGRDLTPTQYNSTNQGIPYMTGASNFENGQLIVNRWTSTPATISKKGDLLITCKGTIGEMAYNNIGEIHIARQIMSISSNYIELPYVKIFLSTLISILNAKAKSIIPGISRENILDAILPLPPLNEQKRISLKIEEIQPLIEKYRVVQEQAEEMDKSLNGLLKKSVLQYAIQGKLVPQIENEESASILLEKIQQEKLRLVKDGKLKKKDLDNSVIFKGDDNKYFEKKGNEVVCIEDEIPFEIPDSWEWVRFKNVAIIARGGSPRPIKSYLTESPNGVNWIKIGDTEKGGKYINSVKEKIKPEGVSSSRMVHKGDFLLTNSMSFGRPYITNVDGCIHDGWLVISPFANTFIQDYLFYLLSSAFAYNQFSEKVSGAVVKNLNIDKVLDAIIPLPPLQEQKRIVKALDNVLASIMRN